MPTRTTVFTGPVDGFAPGSAPAFSAMLWEEIEPVRLGIDALPFVTALADGSLPREVFIEYLAQDAHYLRDYGRALSVLAATAPTREAAVFWAKAAAESVETEQLLHDSHLRGIAPADLPTPSPTCTLYASFLLAESIRGTYATLAAAVLPCFVVYEDVGRRLAERVRLSSRGTLDGHPFADWILTYEDDAFTAAAHTASGLVDEAAASASLAERARMCEVYLRAARCEWMFWDAAWRRESWPV